MKIGNISRQELKEYSKSFNGATLETKARHHKFLFQVDDSGFYYTPSSTMKQRVHENKYIDLVLERFNKKRTLNPSDYQDLTMNASYILVIIEKYLNAYQTNEKDGLVPPLTPSIRPKAIKMIIDLDMIQIGAQYDRPQLAEMWGYETFHAIAKGAVTPKGTPYIILFITREKQEFQTQYEDCLENGVLEIEGETNHAADNRIINAIEEDSQIHLFYRDRHHMPFVYYGQIYLVRYERHLDSPSRFTFRVPSEHPDNTLETELLTHGQPNEEFMPDEEGRRVIRQHVSYERSSRNRKRALEIHGNICMACGFSFDKVYGPDHSKGFIEIHHVKSITEIAGGTVDPSVGLIPLCSNCHSMAHREKGRILTVEEIKTLLSNEQKCPTN